MERKNCMVVNKKLLPVKATYFFTLGGVASLLPYLAVYMKQIRLSASETAIIYGTMPFLGAFVRTLVGAIADKTNKHKATLLVCCLLSGVLHGCLLLVPGRAESRTQAIQMSLQCSPQGSTVKLCTSQNCGRDTVINNSSYSSAVALDVLANSSICKLTCCKLSEPICMSNQTVTSQKCLNSNSSSSSCKELRIQHLTMESYTYDSNQSCVQYRWPWYHHQGMAFSSLTCPEPTLIHSCHINCQHNFPEESNNCLAMEEVGEAKSEKFDLTFWMFFIICLAGQMFFSPIFSLVDAMTYDYLGAEGGKWGQQRVWGSIGFGTFAVISGLTMDIYTNDGGEKNYTFAFVAFAVLSITAGIVVCFYKISQDFACKQIFKNIGSLLRSLEVVMLLIAVFMFGAYTGLIETFLYWHLGTLGGTQLLNGLCMLVNCIPEAVVLVFAGEIIKKIGHIPCLHIALIAYGVRLIAYSFLSNPWVVLAIEPLQAVCFGLMYAAASYYASLLTPPGMSGTIQGLIGALYFGAGKGTGSVVGGLVFERYQAKITFQSYGVCAFIMFAIFFLVHRFVISPSKARQAIVKDTDDVKNEVKESETEHMLNGIPKDTEAEDLPQKDINV